MNSTRKSGSKPGLKGKRLKATRACDRCKKKKTKCSGEQPCDRCSDERKNCEYMSEYTRGREPAIPTRPSRDRSDAWKASNPQVGPLQKPLYRIAPSEKDYLKIDSVPLSNYPASSVNDSDCAQPDSQEFISSRGGSILDRMQNNLHLKESPHQQSSIFMFGDPPLPTLDGSPFFLPPAEIARVMIDKYFDSVATTIRFLHRPTVETWMESYNTNFMGNENWQRNIRATLLMIFANAHSHMGPISADEDPSIRYFLAADYQLQKETGRAQLTSIQARLLQCLYLISRSRINQCWSIFGIVVNLSIALGLNRKQSHKVGGVTDVIQIEGEKRTFWSAYILDKYLSCTLRRPQMFHDEDIDQELPVLVDDDRLQIASLTTANSKPDRAMQATICQIKLSTIIGKLVKDLYGLQPLDKKIRFDLIDKHRNAIEKWRQDVASTLTFHFPDDHQSSAASSMVQRQKTVLMLTYYHVIILLYRPLLVDTFPEVASDQKKMQRQVQECLEASLGIVDIVGRLYKGNPSSHALWFAHYCGYCAVICLYVYVFRVHERPAETWTKYLEAAQKCQQQIDISSEKESFAHRCSGALKVLEADTLECIHRKEGISQYPPVLSGLDGIWNWKTNTVTEKIDRWGFSSLTGY